MIHVRPATLLRPSKSGDVIVPWEGYWEASYDGSPLSCVRACPVEAVACLLHNLVHFGAQA